MKTIPKGTLVSTPLGTGKVVYVRMLSPEFAKPLAYSVCLDKHAENYGYTGTIIMASDVKEISDVQSN